MASLRHRLMLQEAEGRLSDAKRLAEVNSDWPSSDSSHLLALLGFELLLKLVFELATKQQAPSHHKYKDIFEKLPDDVRSDIVSLAKARVGPAAFVHEFDAILVDWSTNFVDLRYPYERYSAMSEEEYAGRATDWVSRGGLESEADFRYHPEALFGVVEAMRQVAARHA